MPKLRVPADHWLAGLTVAVALAGSVGCQRKQPPAAAPDPAPTAAPAPAAAPSAPGAGPTSDAEPPAGTLRAYVWYCDDGQQLVMRNLFREQAIAIDFHDGTRRLDQAPSASGAKYADAITTFWTKGSAATLERQGAPAVKCEERRAESLVEDARARGVTFRALGNEPGWVLEVGPSGRISWTTNFGADRYDFEQSRSAAVDGGMAYSAQQGTHSIKATVKVERCVDDGEVEFNRTAVVEFEGQTYRGCGRELAAR